LKIKPARVAHPVELSTRKKRLPCLDGLRAISIVFVLFSHAQSTFHGTVPKWLQFACDRGGLGVFVFFVLSGFLITYLLKEEYEQTGQVSLRDFYLRRILRIFPAFYTYLLVLAILTATGVISIASSHFLMQGFFCGTTSIFGIQTQEKGMSFWAIFGLFHWKNSFICFGQWLSCICMHAERRS